MATQVEVAAHLDLSDRQVRNLLTTGVLPASKAGKGLDLDACRGAYISYLRGLANGQTKRQEIAGGAELDPLAEQKLIQERLRLTSAQAEGQELKNEIIRRQSVPTDLVTFVLSRLAAEISSILDTLPLTLKRRCPDLEVRHIENVQRELAKARNRAAALDERLPELINDYIDSSD